MNKYEQLIEFIINEQEDKARDLFHQLVVEKSRDIYESLIDEEDFDESIGGNQVQGIMNDVTTDESGMQEEEEEEELGDKPLDSDTDKLGGNDLGGDDMDDMDDMDGEEGTPEEKIENTIMDLESALDELKAEFDQLMGKGGDDMGGMDDMGGDDMGGEFGAPGAEDESIMREYVEDHGQVYKQAPATGEGKTVGKGGDAPALNKQSIVAKPNRMSNSNDLLKGGTEQSADGKPVPTPNNQYTKGRGELKGAGSFENTPNAHTKGYTTRATSYEKAKGKEGETTDGKLPVTSKSVVGGKIR
jgi:hypothetical protein